MRKKSKLAQLFWAALTLFFIMLGIWRGYNIRSYSWFYVLILTGMAMVHGYYGEGLKKIGFRPENFKTCFLRYGWNLLGLASLVLYFGSMLGTARYTDPLRMAKNIGWGLGWGLFQQYVLNGFFVNRLAGFFGDEDNAAIPWLAGGLFSLVHTPNWFLMVAAFFGGWACAKIFLKYRNHRNLYFLGLAHAIIGFLLYLFVPDSIAYHFIIGPGCCGNGN